MAAVVWCQCSVQVNRVYVSNLHLKTELNWQTYKLNRTKIIYLVKTTSIHYKKSETWGSAVAVIECAVVAVKRTANSHTHTKTNQSQQIPSSILFYLCVKWYICIWTGRIIPIYRRREKKFRTFTTTDYTINNNTIIRQCEMAVFLINICKFNGCGIKFDSLGELITHIENIHIGKCENHWKKSVRMRLLADGYVGTLSKTHSVWPKFNRFFVDIYVMRASECAVAVPVCVCVVHFNVWSEQMTLYLYYIFWDVFII